MDAIQMAAEVTRLKQMILRAFGADTGTELIDLADKLSKRSELAPNRSLEIAYQIGAEFGAQAEDVLEEMHLWVERTAEEHHPHNVALYLKALIWVINRRRSELN